MVKTWSEVKGRQSIVIVIVRHVTHKKVSLCHVSVLFFSGTVVLSFLSTSILCLHQLWSDVSLEWSLAPKRDTMWLLWAFYKITIQFYRCCEESWSPTWLLDMQGFEGWIKILHLNVSYSIQFSLITYSFEEVVSTDSILCIYMGGKMKPLVTNFIHSTHIIWIFGLAWDDCITLLLPK